MSASSSVSSRPWRGLGTWNIFFIMEFALAAFGYIELNILANALLIAVLLCPLRGVLHAVRETAAFAAAVALLYSESWLPGIDSFLSNRQAVAGFSTSYILEFALDFINPQMIGWGALIVALYYLVRNYVRVSFFTIGYFLVTVLTPYWEAWQTPVEPEETLTAEASAEKSG